MVYRPFVGPGRVLTMAVAGLAVLWLFLILSSLGHKPTVPLETAANMPKPAAKMEEEEEEETEQSGESKTPSPVPVDEELLFFNRVPKTGSENFVLILQKLSEQNGFVHKRSGRTDLRWRQATLEDQLDQAAKLSEDEQRPLSFDRHVYFFDFESLGEGYVNPVWFSIVRDPISKFESRYHYWRQNSKNMFKKMMDRGDPWMNENVTLESWKGKDIEQCIFEQDPECYFVDGEAYDLTIPYFCGNKDECREHGSLWALEQAIKNVDKFYPVVGLLENLNGTLALAEKKIPLFFAGAYEAYNSQWKDYKKNKTKAYKKISLEARAVLANNLKYEVAFYEHIATKFYATLNQL